jgi:hypothetical protein
LRPAAFRFCASSEVAAFSGDGGAAEGRALRSSLYALPFLRLCGIAPLTAAI